MMARDRMRGSAARKRKVREYRERAQQQARVVEKLWRQAREELRAAQG
jgi:hypothetical protein